jgi:hypothetical protein
MILGKKMIVVMPAYNTEKSIRQTFDELPHEYVDDVILVDDASRDSTAQSPASCGIRTIIHGENRGYRATRRPVTVKLLIRGRTPLHDPSGLSVFSPSRDGNDTHERIRSL